MLRRSSPGFWFLMSLLLALLASIVGYNVLATAAKGVPVVVATQAVPPLQPIPEGAVTVQTRPASGLPTDAVRDISEVVGQYTRTGLVPGAIVQKAMLAGKTEEGLGGVDAQLRTLTDESKSTLRAYPLELTAAQGYQMVQPGQKVDIFAHVKTNAGSGAGVLVSNVTVLAKIDKGVGGNMSGPLAGSGNKGDKSTAAEGVVVLALTPQDAARVTMARDLGTIALAPRPIGDESTPPAPIIRELDLLNALSSATQRPSVPQTPVPQQPSGAEEGENE